MNSTAVKIGIDAIGASIGAISAALLDQLGSSTPSLVVASITVATAVIIWLRRTVKSMLSAGRETIDGLRSENERLRSLLAERDNTVMNRNNQLDERDVNNE